MTITIDDIKEQHNKVAQMISTFEAKAKIANAFPLTINIPELKIGELWVGTIVSSDLSKHEHIILMPGELEESNWQDSMDWAKSIGGDLPNRCESALLFATMKDQFKQEWHWTNEQNASNSDYAWLQSFDYGSQNTTHKSNEYRARAVRRVYLKDES